MPYFCYYSPPHLLLRLLMMVILWIQLFLFFPLLLLLLLVRMVASKLFEEYKFYYKHTVSLLNPIATGIVSRSRHPALGITGRFSSAGVQNKNNINPPLLCSLAFPKHTAAYDYYFVAFSGGICYAQLRGRCGSRRGRRQILRNPLSLIACT